MSEKKNGIDKALIRDLANILNETDLTEIEVEQDDLRIRVSRAGATQYIQAPVPMAAPLAMAPAAAAAPAPKKEEAKPAAAPAPANVTPKQASVAFFKARLTGMPDLKVGIETMVASGDRVAASFVYTGTHGGVYFGVQPTGKPLRFTSCDIFRIHDGLIAEHWGMGDIAGVLAQLRG